MLHSQCALHGGAQGVGYWRCFTSPRGQPHPQPNIKSRLALWYRRSEHPFPTLALPWHTDTLYFTSRPSWHAPFTCHAELGLWTILARDCFSPKCRVMLTCILCLHSERSPDGGLWVTNRAALHSRMPLLHRSWARIIAPAWNSMWRGGVALGNTAYSSCRS